MLDTGMLDIDSEQDLQLMQVIAEYMFHHIDEYGEVHRNVLQKRETH